MNYTQIIHICQAFVYNLLFKTQNTIQTLWLALEKDLRPLLPQIEFSCLIVWGANALTTPLTGGQEESQRIRGFKLVFMNGLSHEWSMFLEKNLPTIVFDFIDEIEVRK